MYFFVYSFCCTGFRSVIYYSDKPGELWINVLVSSSFRDTYYMQLKSSVPATGCCTTSLSLQSIILSYILTEEAMVQKVLVTGQSRLWKVVIMTSKSFGPTQKLIKITLTLLKGSLVPLLNIIALISR